jgi:hypothetical protein
MTTTPFRGVAFSSRTTWWIIMGAVIMVMTLGVHCATPFAALAAVAAVNLSRRDAVLLMGASWLTNQAVGFTMLHYPHNWDCYRGGLELGIAAFACLCAAAFACQWLRTSQSSLALTAIFAVSFVVYEGFLYSVSWTTYAAFSWPTLRYVLILNALAFAVLLVAQKTVSASVLRASNAGARRYDIRILD